MVKYLCNPCNFETDNNTDFKRHLKTKKHLCNAKVKQPLNVNAKEEEKYKCRFCETVYKTSSNLTRHKKTCCEKIINNFKMEKKLTDATNKHKDEIINLLKDNNTDLKIDKKNITTIATSALSFIMQNYADAPNIKKFDDFGLMNFENSAEMANMVAYKQKKNIFGDYISNILVEHYKKEKPSEQCIWNSDVNRLSYIVKDNDKKNTSVWVKDKKGILVTEYAIDPILKHIQTNLTENQNMLVKKTETTVPSDLEMEIMQHSYNLLADIENGESTKDILKCLASHFYVSHKK